MAKNDGKKQLTEEEVRAKAKNAKLAALKRAMAGVNKSLKKANAIRFLNEKDLTSFECLPTGILQLDAACSGRGVKRGTVVELFGPESSGKSLICQKIIAATQRAGGMAAYIDQEFAFDPGFAQKLGVNTDELAISQPDCMEDAFEVIDALINAGVDLIVLDSLASLVPKEELEGGVSDAHIGLVARGMSQALRRWIAALAKSGGVLLIVNQVRDKIGVDKEVISWTDLIKDGCAA